jgi:hypothetical protein
MKRLAVPLAFALMSVAQADPLSTFDEAIVSAAVLDECHVAIPGEIAEDRIRAIAQAAALELWATLSEQNDTQHEENRQKLNFMMNKRTEAAWAQAKALVATKGCPALVLNATEVMETYRR